MQRSSSASGLRRRSSSTSAMTLKGRREAQVTLNDVSTVRRKLTVLERKAAEKEHQEQLLLAEISRQERDLEDALSRVSAAQKDEQELVLRVVEAKLLQDGLLAQQAESHRAIANERRRLHEEHGNSTLKGYTLQNLRAIRQQRMNEVEELNAALGSILAQTAACEAEESLLKEAITNTEVAVCETREQVLDQASQLGVVVESVATALGRAD